MCAEQVQDEIAKQVASAHEIFGKSAEGLPRILEANPQDRRRLLDPLAQSYAEPSIPGVQRQRQADAVLHTPADTLPGPDIIYVHGGGWVFLSPATHARLCDLIAARARRLGGLDEGRLRGAGGARLVRVRVGGGRRCGTGGRRARGRGCGDV